HPWCLLDLTSAQVFLQTLEGAHAGGAAPSSGTLAASRRLVDSNGRMRSIQRPRRPGTLRVLMPASGGPARPRPPPPTGALLSPPHPWHRPPGTLVSEPAACSTSDRYSPLVGPSLLTVGFSVRTANLSSDMQQVRFYSADEDLG